MSELGNQMDPVNLMSKFKQNMASKLMKKKVEMKVNSMLKQGLGIANSKTN